MSAEAKRETIGRIRDALVKIEDDLRDLAVPCGSPSMLRQTLHFVPPGMDVAFVASVESAQASVAATLRLLTALTLASGIVPVLGPDVYQRQQARLAGARAEAELTNA